MLDHSKHCMVSQGAESHIRGASSSTTEKLETSSGSGEIRN